MEMDIAQSSPLKQEYPIKGQQGYTIINICICEHDSSADGYEDEYADGKGDEYAGGY